MVQQAQSVPSTRAASRRTSVCLSENRSEEVELSAVSKRPSLLRVPSASNQEISANNNDVSADNTQVYLKLMIVAESYKLTVTDARSFH